MWQAVPPGQGAVQGRMREQVPVPGSQYSPAPQRTPTQGTGKQPAMHRPSTQVCWASQRTPSQGSRRVTHWARQLLLPQVFASVLHGSPTHTPPRQRSPGAQKRSSGQRRTAVSGVSDTSASSASAVSGAMSRPTSGVSALASAVTPRLVLLQAAASTASRHRTRGRRPRVPDARG